MERLSFNVFRRASMSTDIKRHGARRRDGGTGNFWVLPRLIDFRKPIERSWSIFAAQWSRPTYRAWKRIFRFNLSRPTNPDLIVDQARQASHLYLRVGGLSRCLWASKIHCGSQESPDRQATWRAARRDRLCTNFGLGHRWKGLSAYRPIPVSRFSTRIERGAGVGFLPTSAIALGAPLVAIDLGINYHMDLWLTYHKEFRNSDRHKIVIEWLKKIFDPKAYACFRDQFIHPNDLTPLMLSSRQNFGLQGTPHQSHSERRITGEPDAARSCGATTSTRRRQSPGATAPRREICRHS